MSQRERHERASTLFQKALEVPEEEREAWLEARADEEPELVAEVRSLLRAHDREGGLLDRSLPVPEAPEEDILPRLRRALEGRYRIESELGFGATSRVFLAWETKHDRKVVLKVLNPDIAALFGPERFEREVRLAAQLSHPHIVGLIDSGNAEGLLYYVMPHVEGETLAERLERRGRLPTAQALVLLRDIAEALEAAHETGVIHRDLKPANVL